MRVYPSQPVDVWGTVEIPSERVARRVEAILKEELPDCAANKWFMSSVHGANVVDKIVEDVERAIAGRD